ncbi:MAG: hypothetical protein C0504_03810 [Candidatus Solibacter sp.]|nr:hypothetical protein [Candidatus Solibacter sp.]
MARFAATFAALLLAAAPLAHAASLKYEHGHLIRLDPRDESLWLDSTHIEAARLARRFRRITIRDFSLNARATLAVSASASLGAGVLTNVILLFNTAAPASPEVIATGDVFCDHLAWGGEDLYCLGPDFRKMVAGEPYSVLWRIPPNGDIHPVLPRDRFPPATAPPWKTAALGDAQLLSARDALWIFHPGAAQLFRFTPSTSELSSFPVNVNPAGRSRISIAIWNDTPLALLPLRQRGDESFTTPYALFSFSPHDRRWLTASSAKLPRGAQLLAVDGNHALLWDRRGKGRLLRIALDAPAR